MIANHFYNDDAKVHRKSKCHWCYDTIKRSGHSKGALSVILTYTTVTMYTKIRHYFQLTL